VWWDFRFFGFIGLGKCDIMRMRNVIGKSEFVRVRRCPYCNSLLVRLGMSDFYYCWMCCRVIDIDEVGVDE
jgi:hypothetical protein